MKRKKFQSTSPYAGDDYTTTSLTYGMINFNPRPPTRGTTRLTLRIFSGSSISIHVPLRGGRPQAEPQKVERQKFQSTSPYAGDDIYTRVIFLVIYYFNPRPPTRGTTAKLYKIFGGFCSLFATIITKRIIRPGIALAF